MEFLFRTVEIFDASRYVFELPDHGRALHAFAGREKMVRTAGRMPGTRRKKRRAIRNKFDKYAYL